MIKSKIIRNIILTIPLLCCNFQNVITHPNYVDCESPTSNKLFQSNTVKFLKDIKKKKKEYDKRLKEEEKARIEEQKKLEETKSEEVEEQKIQEILVEVSFYCPCEICCDSETHIMANGEQVYYGAIAAPIELEFGTELEFDGQVWTVCDRGGYIQSYTDEYGNIIYKLDVFLPDHQECLDRGRYITTAKIIVDK